MATTASAFASSSAMRAAWQLLQRPVPLFLESFLPQEQVLFMHPFIANLVPCIARRDYARLRAAVSGITQPIARNIKNLNDYTMQSIAQPCSPLHKEALCRYIESTSYLVQYMAQD